MDKVKIKDLCDILNGFAFKSDNYVDKGIRIIRIANVQKGYIEDSTPAFYPLNSTGLDKYMLDKGDLLISLTGNVGRVAILQEEMLPAALNQRVACLRIKSNKISKGYLFHILNSDFFERKCIQSAKGVAQKNMSTEWLKNYKIPLYSTEQQSEIVSVLDTLQSIICNRKNELQMLDNLIKARFVEMFGTEREFERWSCCTIGDVAKVGVGVVIKPTQYYTDDGIPAFRSLNIGEMKVKDNDWVYFTEEGHKKNQKSVVKTNDVLVVRSGAPGTACVATEKYNGYNAVDIIIAHPDQDKVNSVFLAAFTNMPHGMNQIKGGTGGAAQQHFNVSGYKAMTLIMPPMRLQEQFADFVAQIDKSKHHFYSSSLFLGILNLHRSATA
mgnify:CR=1 FL=1